MKVTLACMVWLSFIATSLVAQQKHEKSLILMGTAFQLTVYEDDSQKAWNAINAGIDEIRRIEALISSWDPNSQTSLINKHAGKGPVLVDKELYGLIKRSIQISKVTDGAFDISFASMDRIWKFDGSMSELPQPEEVERASQYIDYQQIRLNDAKQTVLLNNEGMKIGFGAIGKGYAAERAKQVIQEMGIRKGVINAAGDLALWGGEEQLFSVVITDPSSKGNGIGHIMINEGAIVTSGDYEKYVVFNGLRYAHIIDPRTGYPTTGIKSVTITARNAELADALSTTVFVLGIERGLRFIAQLPGVECLIIDDQNDLHYSQGMEIKLTGL